MHPPEPSRGGRLPALFLRLGAAPLGLFGAFASLIVLCGAAPSPVEAAFGGTLVSTYPDGRTGELYLKADGSYTARGRRGDPSNGHWKVNDDKLCLNQSSPLPVPFAFCTPIPEGLHGEWSAKAVTGEAIRVKLVKGHFLGKAKPTATDDDGKQQTASP
jgi:hypothetical protein